MVEFALLSANKKAGNRGQQANIKELADSFKMRPEGAQPHLLFLIYYFLFAKPEVLPMYFHAGQDFVLNTRDVIGVFDLDTAGASRRTEEYFRHRERGRRRGPLRPGHAAQELSCHRFPRRDHLYQSVIARRAEKKSGEIRILKLWLPFIFDL